MTLPLYPALVRPDLDCSVLGSSGQEMEHLATKVIEGLEHLSYEERLGELGLFILQKRRLRGNKIGVCTKGDAREGSQALLSSAQQQDKRQWAAP